MQWMVPSYLEYSMQAFARNQEQMRDYFQTAFGGMFPFSGFGEMSKHNLALFERAMRMFTPFGSPGLGGLPSLAGIPGLAPDMARAQEQLKPPEGDTKPLEALQRQVDELQQQLAALTKPAAVPTAAVTAPALAEADSEKPAA
jgi:polyhydroxyalkanoate synthesis regulator protein